MKKDEPHNLAAQIRAFAAEHGYKMVPALPASFDSDPARMSDKAISDARPKLIQECPGEPIAIDGRQGKTCPICNATILYGGGRHYRPKD